MQGKIQINGKWHSAEVRNGERYIDGLSVNEFFATLDQSTVEDIALIGHTALQDERNDSVGEDPKKYQKMANALHSRRVN